MAAVVRLSLAMFSLLRDSLRRAWPEQRVSSACGTASCANGPRAHGSFAEAMRDGLGQHASVP